MYTPILHLAGAYFYNKEILSCYSTSWPSQRWVCRMSLFSNRFYFNLVTWKKRYSWSFSFRLDYRERDYHTLTNELSNTQVVSLVKEVAFFGCNVYIVFMPLLLAFFLWGEVTCVSHGDIVLIYTNFSFDHTYSWKETVFFLFKKIILIATINLVNTITSCHLKWYLGSYLLLILTFYIFQHLDTTFEGSDLSLRSWFPNTVRWSRKDFDRNYWLCKWDNSLSYSQCKKPKFRLNAFSLAPTSSEGLYVLLASVFLGILCIRCCIYSLPFAIISTHQRYNLTRALSKCTRISLQDQMFMKNQQYFLLLYLLHQPLQAMTRVETYVWQSGTCYHDYH